MPQMMEESVQTNISPADAPECEWRWNGESWDRRSSVRLDLSYSLCLRRPGIARPIEGQTTNISFSGFCFWTDVPFCPQEKVEYEMVMPWSASPGVPQVEMILRGTARVIRVDSPRPGAKYGVACRLEGDYTISRRDQERGSALLPVEAQAC